METATTYRYLRVRSDKKTPELFVSDTAIRASTIWHDRYISRMSPPRIAHDRDLPLEAVYEALAYCQEHWEDICAMKEAERLWLQQHGFVTDTTPEHT